MITMNEKKLSYHVSAFNEKVRVMNQSGGKGLNLSAEDARNLQSDIFSLLAKITELSTATSEDSVAEVKLDGGVF